MPKRPQQHQTAAKAENSVRSLWVNGGHAVDTIREDYGEDLLVQTCLRERVDASRIWVQVKGTTKDCSDEQSALPVLYINAEQVLRWSRSSDLVIVTLWDVNNNVGWYTIPDGSFDHVTLSNAGTSAIPITFERSRRFDESAVEYLSWFARIDHADRSVGYSLSVLAEAEEEEEEEAAPAYAKHHQAAIASVVHQLAIDIGVFSRDGEMTSDFKSALSEGVKQIDGETGEQILGRSILWALAQTAYANCARNGLPSTLLVELTENIKHVSFGEIFRRASAIE
ncbi:DUF4365 domain-containing protein [Streptomyces sp. NPDC059224]|uniref:DUF4365 domain-containing protein n=1 Tax=Streptomyces sp. NPDC059224 TaxID=3346775 RepID=UPI0036C6C14E